MINKKIGKNLAVSLASVVLLTGVFLCLRYLFGIIVDWGSDFTTMYLLSAAVFIGTGLTVFLHFFYGKKKLWVFLLLSVFYGLVCVGSIYGLTVLNSILYNGYASGKVLNVSVCFIVATQFLLFVWLQIRIVRKEKNAVVQAVAWILLGSFCTYMASDWAFYNYIHRDRYKEISTAYISTEISLVGKTVSFTTDCSGVATVCILSYTGNGGWRLQTDTNGLIDDYGAAELLNRYLNEENKTEKKDLFLREGKSCTVTSVDDSYVVIEKNPMKLRFYSGEGKVLSEITSIGKIGNQTIIRGSLNKSEAVWGGGQRFNTVNQRGKQIYINAIDKMCETEGNSYLPIPLFLSSRGSGLFMNRYERMYVDIDSYEVPKNTWQFTLSDTPCDLYVYATTEPSRVLYGYSTLTGFADEPASWSYGTVVCRYAPEFMNLEGVKAMAENMEKEGFPWEAVIIEGFDTNNLEGLREVSDYVHSIGKKLMIYISMGKNYYLKYETDLSEDELFVHTPDGNTYLPQAMSDNPLDNPNPSPSQYFDITNEAVRALVFEEIFDTLMNEYDVDGMKVDFCELFPDYYELEFADGTTSGAHHWYPSVYTSLLADKMSEKESGYMLFVRGGGIGSQRYPYIWMGDQRREIQCVAAQLKGVLSLGLSGVPFTSYDMAGYVTGTFCDDKKTFIRATEMTAFTANVQTHGNVKRPYDYDEETKALYRKYMNIHELLRPYLEETGKNATETGIPIMRHLALSYWDDEKVWDIDDEYMLGDDFLVAPVLSYLTSRSVYFPEGEWIHIFTGEKYKGKTTELLNVAMEEIPVFVKAESYQKHKALLEAVAKEYGGQ